MLTQTQISQIKFVARLENIKGLHGSLKAINFGENAKFQLSENGLRVTVEHSKNVQASVYITKQCFIEFRIPPNETINFSADLNIITECLSIFTGVNCNMKMLYKGEGAPLILVLEHHGEDEIITECSIKTKKNEDYIDYSFDENGPSFNQIIIRGPDLANLFNEIDKSADELELFLSPYSPFFRITIIGVMQSESNVEVAKSSDMILSFACNSTTSKRYRLSHIRLAMKSLLLAAKIAIKTDSSGLLSLQLMILSDGEAQIYIEFFIPPLVELN